MSVTPRIFLLNEQHELGVLRRDGGGGGGQLKLNWSEKGTSLRSSLRSTLDAIKTTVDPTAPNHHFLSARPDKTLQYEGTTKGKPELKTKLVNFGGRESKLFRRLGMDLIGAAGDAAIIHISAANQARLQNELNDFEAIGLRRRADFAAIAAFQPIPMSSRFSAAWFDSERAERAERRVDAMLEFMPILKRAETDEVMAVLQEYLQALDESARWKRLGRDFSRRSWVRVEINQNVLERLLNDFPSIQRAHPPIYYEAAASPVRRAREASTAPGASVPTPQRVVSRPPVVAIVDMGIPPDHQVFSAAQAYLGGDSIVFSQYAHSSGSRGASGHHGSKVASRIAFPPLESDPATTPEGPLCRVVDINACDPEEDFIDAKVILPMMQTAMTVNPDVRVFNLSCRMRGASLSALQDTGSPLFDEALRATADFDNFAHRNDALIVIAGGNAPEGAIPSPVYPEHFTDLRWHLAAPAFAANALTVGSTVGVHVSGTMLVDEKHRPSPFARVGESPVPGIKPDFSAVGGNQLLDGGENSWTGVPVMDRHGGWTRATGSSFAAPCVAREAAFLWRKLRDLGINSVDPYAITVKACLALTAQRKANESGIEKLARVSLGYGYVDANPWFLPHANQALLVWQGQLKAANDRARVQFPIPAGWLEAAGEPILRVFWCWDPPVNAAVPDVWICRDVTLQLRASANDKTPALRGKRPVRKQASYPLRTREFSLETESFDKSSVEPPKDGIWTLELGYSEIAELPDPTLSSFQRVAVAAELIDKQNLSSPQEFLQAMPIATTMNRFSAMTPIAVRIVAG